MIREEDIESYVNDGYLVVNNVLTADEVTRLRSAISEMKEKSRLISSSDDIFVLGNGHSYEAPSLRRIVSPELHHPAFSELVHHPAILDIVEDLIGHDIRFDHGKINIKEPACDDAAIEWHQDWAFYPHTNGDVLAVGICITDCLEDNGPLLVIPGSHEGPILEHNAGNRFLGAAELEEVGLGNGDAVALTAPAGSITLHHVRTLHGSRANTGTTERALLLNTYKAADSWPLLSKFDLATYDSMMVRGSSTWQPRMESLPVRLPADLGQIGLFTTQEPVRGRSFGNSAQ